VPAPKKPVDPDESEELAEVKRQLAEAHALLQTQQPAGEDRFTALMELLADRLAQPVVVQQPEREVALSKFGTAGQIMDEADHQLEALPEPEDPLDHEKVYLAKGRNFTIIFKARRALQDAEGNSWMRAGQHVTFAPFGEFRTRDPRMVAFLEERDSFGREFWDAENIPGSVPDIGVALERVSQYAVDLNLDGLHEMEAEERAGLNRQELMRSIKAAQRQVGLMKEKIDKQKQVA
jgi:hypothetical protein